MDSVVWREASSRQDSCQTDKIRSSSMQSSPYFYFSTMPFNLRAFDMTDSLEEQYHFEYRQAPLRC